MKNLSILLLVALFSCGKISDPFPAYSTNEHISVWPSLLSNIADSLQNTRSVMGYSYKVLGESKVQTSGVLVANNTYNLSIWFSDTSSFSGILTAADCSTSRYASVVATPVFRTGKSSEIILPLSVGSRYYFTFSNLTTGSTIVIYIDKQ